MKKVLILIVLMLVTLVAASTLSGTALADGGGFPTATPTATLVPTPLPTVTPTEVAVVIPPTATAVVMAVTAAPSNLTADFFLASPTPEPVVTSGAPLSLWYLLGLAVLLIFGIAVVSVIYRKVNG